MTNFCKKTLLLAFSAVLAIAAIFCCVSFSNAKAEDVAHISFADYKSATETYVSNNLKAEKGAAVLINQDYGTGENAITVTGIRWSATFTNSFVRNIRFGSYCGKQSTYYYYNYNRQDVNQEAVYNSENTYYTFDDATKTYSVVEENNEDDFNAGIYYLRGDEKNRLPAAKGGFLVAPASVGAENMTFETLTAVKTSAGTNYSYNGVAVLNFPADEFNYNNGAADTTFNAVIDYSEIEETYKAKANDIQLIAVPYIYVNYYGMYGNVYADQAGMGAGFYAYGSDNDNVRSTRQVAYAEYVAQGYTSTTVPEAISNYLAFGSDRYLYEEPDVTGLLGKSAEEISAVDFEVDAGETLYSFAIVDGNFVYAEATGNKITLDLTGFETGKIKLFSDVKTYEYDVLLNTIVINSKQDFVDYFARTAEIAQSSTGYRELEPIFDSFYLNTDLAFDATEDADLIAQFKAYNSPNPSTETTNISSEELSGIYEYYKNGQATLATGELADYTDFCYDVQNYGFCGVFNGNGHTISGLVIPKGGLFGVINGTIKNVAFVDCTGENVLLADTITTNAVIENVYIKISSNLFVANYVLDGVYVGNAKAKFNNVLVETTYNTFNGVSYIPRWNGSVWAYVGFGSHGTVGGTGLVVISASKISAFSNYSLTPKDITGTTNVRYASIFDIAFANKSSVVSPIADNDYFDYVAGVPKWFTAADPVLGEYDGYYDAQKTLVTEITLHNEFGANFEDETVTLTKLEDGVFSSVDFTYGDESIEGLTITNESALSENFVDADGNQALNVSEILGSGDLVLTYKASNGTYSTANNVTVTIADANGDEVASGNGIDYTIANNVVTITSKTAFTGKVVVAYKTDVLVKEYTLTLTAPIADAIDLKSVTLYIDDAGIPTNDSKIVALFEEDELDGKTVSEPKSATGNFTVADGLVKATGTLTVGNDYTSVLAFTDCDVEVTFKFVTKVIRTADDFLNTVGKFTYFSSVPNASTTPARTGFYVLNNDIDIDDTTKTGEAKLSGFCGSQAYLWYGPNFNGSGVRADLISNDAHIAGLGFAGTFLGQDYEVANVTLFTSTDKFCNYGIFGLITGKAVVKDVTFTNVKTSTTTTQKYGSLIARYKSSTATVTGVTATYASNACITNSTVSTVADAK